MNLIPTPFTEPRIWRKSFSNIFYRLTYVTGVTFPSRRTAALKFIDQIDAGSTI